MNIEGEEGETAVLETEIPLVEEVATEPVVQETVAEPEKVVGKKPDPLISEITRLRAKLRDTETESERHRREATDAKALAERLSKGEGGGDVPKPVTEAVRTLDDAEIDRRADYKLFLREVADMRQSGEASFGKPDFDGVIQSLTAYGADNDEFIRHVMAVDRANAHAMLKDIAEDPARAIGLVNMNPTQRLAELTRMSIAAKTKTTPAPTQERTAAPRAVSNAPRPAPALSSSTSASADWRADKATDAEFSKGFDDHWAKRAIRR